MTKVKYEYDVVLTKTGDVLARYYTREEARIEKRDWNNLLFDNSNRAKIIQRKYEYVQSKEVR